MNAEEKRLKVLEKYKPMLGRNYYSQDINKREYAVSPYKDGKYYSDCSSSIRLAYKAADIGLNNIGGNTAGIHSKGRKIPVTIVNGQITDPEKLRPGDCLMFAGNDPARPLQIGHVEMFVKPGVLWGHGSGRPSQKVLKDYLAARYAQKASNGVRKGIVEVRRFIEDDPADPAETPSEENPIGTGSSQVMVMTDLNIRDAPEGEWVGVYRAGDKITPFGKCFLSGSPWFRTDKGWISAKYLQGWILEDGRWWYLEPGYKYPTATVQNIQGAEYAFDSAGWMLTADRISASGAII